MVIGRCWRARAFGPPAEVLRLEEEELAPPGEGRMIVKVATAGIGLPDVLMMKNAYPGVGAPPITPAQEVCGEVVAVHAGSSFKVGERVMGMTPFMEGWGGCCDYAYVREAKAIRAPAALSDEEAAGFLLAFRTAYAALVDRVPVQAGQHVAVLGGAGSSGGAAIQLAKALGARVTAIAGGKAKTDFCLSIGADAVVDYRAEDDLAGALHAAAGKVDIVFDPVGGDTAGMAVKALARGGRVAMVGYAGGSWLKADPTDMVLRNYGVIGVFAGGYSAVEDQSAYQALVDLARAGRIRTPVGTVSSFDDVPATIAALSSPPPGKSIVRIAT